VAYFAYEMKQEFCRISSIQFESNFGRYFAYEIKRDAAECPEYEVTGTLCNVLHMKINKAFRFFLT